MKRLVLLFPLACAVAALCSCAVDQNKEVATYRKLIDDPSTRPAQVEPGRTVTLSQALVLANQNEEPLASQGESYLQALIAKDRAFAAFLPTLAADPSYSRTDTIWGSGPNAHSVAVPLAAQWNLFNGLRDYNTLKADEATIEQRKQLVLDLQQTILLEVSMTYFQVLSDEAQVASLRASLAEQDENVKLTQSQMAVGTATNLALAQAESLRSSTVVSIDQAKSAVQTARATLAFLVGAPIQYSSLEDDLSVPDFGVRGKLTGWLQAETPAWVKVAETNRQDLLAAVSATKAARSQVEVAVGEYYPTLNVNLNYYLYQTGVPAADLLSGLISANVPIFEGGAIEADVRNAWSVYRQAALAESLTRRTIEEEMTQALVGVEVADQSLTDLEVEVKAASDTVYYANQQYKAGTATELDYLTAEATFEAAHVQLVSDVFAEKMAYLNVLRQAAVLKWTVAQAATRPTDPMLIQLEENGAATQPYGPTEP